MIFRAKLESAGRKIGGAGRKPHTYFMMIFGKVIKQHFFQHPIVIFPAPQSFPSFQFYPPNYILNNLIKYHLLPPDTETLIYAPNPFAFTLRTSINISIFRN